MTPLSAFVSFMAIFADVKAGGSRLPKTEPPRPTMLPCGKNGECPKGSMCMKLIGDYGVCVVSKYDA